MRFHAVLRGVVLDVWAQFGHSRRIVFVAGAQEVGTATRALYLWIIRLQDSLLTSSVGTVVTWGERLGWAILFSTCFTIC